MLKTIIKKVITITRKIQHLKRCKIPFNAVLLGKNNFEGKNKIGRFTYLKDCSLGYGSYCGENCYFYKSVIGRYVSIGSNVKVIHSTHPISESISSHPAFYKSSVGIRFKYTNNEFNENLLLNNSVCVEIGNDVWIGENVILKGGIRIGDGSIIAMGAVVTKDVPPYSVVGGIPAKIIKYRFDEQTIKKLLQIKWWEKPKSWIVDHADSFFDIDLFLDKGMSDK